MSYMRKKRKGCEGDCSNNDPSLCDSRSPPFKIRAQYSFCDNARLVKTCRGDAGENKSLGFCQTRFANTAPTCGVSSLVLPGRGRGIKRKIGCIDTTTQLGRKNKIEDDFIFQSTIGRGKFGSVSSCRGKADGVEFACKTLVKGEETVHREVEIMQHLSGHPGVVTLQAVYEDPGSFHLVMELCSGGRLVDKMFLNRQCSEHWAANTLKELMLVIKYCHDMGVVHRDIKPENILLSSSGNLKLADFGSATRVSKGQRLEGLAGSPAFVAPEVLLGSYSEKVDIWSAGVLLHALLVGVLPFQGNSVEAFFEAIKHTHLDFHKGKWDEVSEPARDLVWRMLSRDVSGRVSADEVLRHPWIVFHTEEKQECSHEADMMVCGLVDALSEAISHIQISEPPKRSKLCGPAKAELPCNLIANSECEAF